MSAGSTLRSGAATFVRGVLFGAGAFAAVATLFVMVWPTADAHVDRQMKAASRPRASRPP